MNYTIQKLDKISRAIQPQFNLLVKENKYLLDKFDFNIDDYSFDLSPSKELFEAYSKVILYNNNYNSVVEIIEKAKSSMDFNLIDSIAKTFDVCFAEEEKSKFIHNIILEPITHFNFKVTPPEPMPKDIFTLQINDEHKHFKTPLSYINLSYENIIRDYYPNLSVSDKYDIDVTVNDKNYLLTPQIQWELDIKQDDIVSIFINYES